MKFGKSVLLEIVDVVREGLLTGKDISQALREIDVVEKVGGLLNDEDVGKLVLSDEYVATHPRADEWE